MKNGRRFTRRSLLQGAGAAIAAAMFPPTAGLAGEPASPAMTRLSTYMSEAKTGALPADVIEKAKHHILDTFFAKQEGRPLPAVPADFKLNYSDPYAHGGSPVAGGQ